VRHAALVVGLALGAGQAAAGPSAGSGAGASGAGGAAASGAIDLPDTPAEITVPGSWKVSALPDVEGKPVAAYESNAGGRVVITRANAHNPEAWLQRTRTRYADAVEAGVAKATEGYKRKTRTVQKVNGVPCMDLEISRTVDGVKEDVVLRFVFFRTYTLTAAAIGPKKDRAAITAILRSFGPPKGYIP
jgi:hypothetical protein